MAVGMGIYFSHVTVWEKVCACADKGDALTIYQQPAYLRTPNVLVLVEAVAQQLRPQQSRRAVWDAC